MKFYYSILQAAVRAAAFCFLAAAAMGQSQDPIQWEMTAITPAVAPSTQATFKLTAKMGEGWHLYSLTTPKGGANPTTIKAADPAVVTGLKVYQPKPEPKLDPNFGVNTETYEHSSDFYVVADMAGSATGEVEVVLNLRYQACTDKLCMPPKKKTASAKIKIDSGIKMAAFTPPATHVEAVVGAATPAAASVKTFGTSTQTQGLGQFLLLAFGLGLAALLTPCVFPMIPVTMSFFLNQGAATRGAAIKQASVFSLGIIFLFTSLGLAITALVGPFGVVQLGSNPWVNGFISIVFLVFALSLLGAFEITIPSSVLTKLNKASEQGGLLGTLLMGLTFSLTSFACVGPFVGTLLAASVQGDKLQPALGMIFFSAGLALPFFFLAMFPAYLQRLPRSGAWMVRVKVVLGFLILAAMLKYLSNVDQVLQWGVLSRGRFLAAWVVLFALPGLYLLGLLRMEGIKPEEPVDLKRLIPGLLLLVFSISLIPGLLGMRLGELEAYIPTIEAAASIGGSGEAATGWLKNDYDGALAQAKTSNKRVLIAFTGYACTNCHWMKANMFPRSEVAAAMKEMVLVELYTDGTDSASESNQKLQEKTYQTVAIPYYAIVDGEGKTVATFAGLTRDPQEFLKFLEQGKVS